MNDASPIFASLGHPGRLAVFRLLMRHAPQGVRPTEIADSLTMKQNTLSHHLADLDSAGLIAATREGARSITASGWIGLRRWYRIFSPIAAAAAPI